jgi:hypothetical protein
MLQRCYDILQDLIVCSPRFALANIDAQLLGTFH